jgi:hypothetical protein
MQSFFIMFAQYFCTLFSHIIVPRKMWREITRLTAGKTTPLLTHDEVANNLRIPMSTDWVHYLSHQYVVLL